MKSVSYYNHKSLLDGRGANTPFRSSGANSFILLIILSVLTIFVSLTGVPLNREFGLPSGGSGIAEFLIKLLAILMLGFRMARWFILISTILLFYLCLGVVVFPGALMSSVSQLLNLFGWAVLIKLAFNSGNISQVNIVRRLCLILFIYQTVIFFYFVAVLLNIVSEFSKPIGGSWAFDVLFRFSGGFGEPSLIGLFSGFCLYFSLSKIGFFLRASPVLKGLIVLLALIFLVVSASKFPVIGLTIGFLIAIGYRIYCHNIMVALLPLVLIGIYLLVFLWVELFPSGVWDVAQAILSFGGYESSRSFFTRLGFHYITLQHLVDYPFGAGVNGYRSTLLEPLVNYIDAGSRFGFDTSEMSEYYADPASDNFSPKDVLSQIILTFGWVGLGLFSVFMSWLLRTASRHGFWASATAGYLITAMLLVTPLNSLLCFVLLVFVASFSKIEANKYESSSRRVSTGA